MTPPALRRGEVWFADLDPPFGHEAGRRRPVVVLQSDALLHLNTVLIVPLTTARPHRVVTVSTTVIRAGDGGVAEDSFALCHQLRTIPREYLLERLGTLSGDALADIEVAVLFTLGLQ